MATKRSPPKDLDDPSVLLKQPRLDVSSQVSAFLTKPPTPSHQGPHIPTANLSCPAALLPDSAQPASTLSSQITTGFIHGIAVPPERSAIGFHSSQATMSSSSCAQPIVSFSSTPRMTYPYQQTPPFVAAVGEMQNRNHTSAQMVHSRPIPVSTVTAVHTSISNSPAAAPTLPSPSLLYFTPSTSSQITTELIPGKGGSVELTCSSPSQFLHPPTSVCIPSSPSAVTAAPADNRQPVCLSEKQQRKYKVGSDVDLKSMKLKVIKYRRGKLASLKFKHEVDLKEKFFLETGGNMVDIVTWKKKPNTKRDTYLKLNDVDSEAVAYDRALSSGSGQAEDEGNKLKLSSAVRSESKIDSKALLKQQKSSVSKLERPEESSITSTTIQIPLSTVSPSVCGGTPSSPIKTPQFPPSPRPATRLHSSFSSIYETSHEDIVMRARHEAEVMRAISELRKEGLWSGSRLPKVQEPQRRKTHWDYLLEEMQWLATDFANERRWKMNAAKKICRSVSGYYRELEMQQVRSEKEETLRLRKIASSIAKEVKHFWDSIQKVVEHKQQLLLEEKRKKAMDMHLEFIVDQTTKYSNWLVKGLNATSSTMSPSEPSLSATTSIDDSDAFLTPDETTDDEETIEKEELLVEEEDGRPNYTSEIQALQEEGEMPLEQLLASLPPEILKEEPHSPECMEIGLVEKGSKLEGSGVETTVKSDNAEDGESSLKVEDNIRPERSHRKSGSGLGDSDEAYEGVAEISDTNSDKECDDVEYKIDIDVEEEDETTIDEQETHEGQVDYADELKALNEEGELPLELLLQIYNLEQRSAVAEDRGEISVNEPVEELGLLPQRSEEEKGSEASSAEEESGDEENGQDSLEFLISGKRIEEVCQTEAGFSDVAAVAEQFQPKGITLATTEVKTNIPFLLKHKLREYQHIGLDWLVAMHDKRLNGILADEMGLGKTIQTIALLAHLACEKANWGPHLIVVPTSVMLNWEYELKKWCPAFKILTYFGSFKERKLKRVGWTKRNAFHVCITSYNIAVTDHRAFKQMKWKYLILDEAQNIKNFKSQRWQTLLTFNSQRRLLLTGTPLQNNLMELWSLMHFLMPTVFSSHSDFREWFSNPLTGMVEGSQEYNDSIVKRLHQVLRPFLLRRLKMEVEKQMPRKYEHVVLCRLSKRQRFLYDEYMSRRKTKDTLAAGNYLSVINILMQLRKVCNHPDLFEPRPIISPLRLTAMEFYTASLLFTGLERANFEHVNLDHLNLQLSSYELCTEAFAAFRSRQLQAPRALMIDPTRSQIDLQVAGGVADEEEEEEEEEKFPSSVLKDLHMPNLAWSREEWTISRRRHIHEVNSRRCRRIPMYGIDLVKAVGNICSPSETTWQTRLCPPCCTTTSHWLWSGYAACLRQQVCSSGWEEYSSVLEYFLPSYDRRALQLKEIMKRFIITVPCVTAPSITLHTHLHTPGSLAQDTNLVSTVATDLGPCSGLLHCASTSMCLQFPETRLIQYDCGKLQSLDILLHNLKADNHRVLIFTQMARVLDILEIFLNYHGHTYLRLDGATPVQKRQALMDRFNRDERIFCFILSTRSGGLGVNLTGADTVVFYDSDWNPTMDAQAQDRCHRIGQTRDVHIYRLVCESTIEENILKKANQKRMLGDIAIEGGVFTTDFFKEATLRDLFRVKQEAITYETSEDLASDEQAETLSFSPKQIEDLLMQAEDESDAQAASKAKAEQVAERAEFDEGFCTQVDPEHAIDRHTDIDNGSKVMSEFAEVEDQLSGVERYAMRYLEETNAEFAAEQLKIAEESIEQAKKSWELSHLQSLREEEERIADEDVDDEMLLTYDRPEASNKIFVDKVTGEEMPIWLPPTPPAENNEDYYVDIVLDLAYDTNTTITPAELASIAPYSEEDYDVLGLSRHYPEAEPIKKSQKSYSKQTLKEHINVPPSLFWRRYAIDTLSTKLKKLASHQKKLKVKDQFSPLLEQQPEGPEWSHLEDWLLLKGVTEVLEFPLSLAITVPAQMPNWSIIADLISLLSKIRRSPLQCREHLMNVVIPREDSTIKGDDTVESKKHKIKDSVSKKPKSRKEQRTKNVVIGDNGVEQTDLFTVSFDKVLDITSKRKQASKFTLDSIQKPSTHADLLKDYGIHMDTVLSPMQVAHQRAERIQSELPRHSSQVHQLLAQPYHFSLMRNYAAAAAAAGAPFMKPSVTGYSLSRQVPANVAITTTSVQRYPSVSSTTASSQLPTNTAVVTQGVPPISSQPISTSVNTTQPSTPATLVPAKTFNVAANASDISKTIRGNITHQQLLLLRQSALQQQTTANRPPSSTQLARPVIAQQQATPSVQSPTTTIAQKVALPSGIEQLRASLSLPAPQRFPAITSGNAASRPLTGNRTLQTEDVLALLKQQSLRITATQSFKTGHAVSSQLHSQTPFQFRPEQSHLTTKVPSTVVPLDALKLANSSTTPATDIVQTQLKVEPTVEQSQGTLPKQQQQVQSQSMSAPFSTSGMSSTLSLGTQPSSNKVSTAVAQNLVKAQIQHVLAQQQQIKSAHGAQLPKSTAQ